MTGGPAWRWPPLTPSHAGEAGPAAVFSPRSSQQKDRHLLTPLATKFLQYLSTRRAPGRGGSSCLGRGDGVGDSMELWPWGPGRGWGLSPPRAKGHLPAGEGGGGAGSPAEMEEEEPSPLTQPPLGAEQVRPLGSSPALRGRAGWPPCPREAAGSPPRKGGMEQKRWTCVHVCGRSQKPVLSTTSFTLTPCCGTPLWVIPPQAPNHLPPHLSLSPPPPHLPFREMLKMRQPWFQTQFSSPRVRDLR